MTGQDNMISHIKILGWIHVIFGALGLMAAFVIFTVFGGIAGLVGVSGDSDARVAAPILVLIGGVVLVIIAVLSIPGLIGGIGLLNFKPVGAHLHDRVVRAPHSQRSDRDDAGHLRVVGFNESGDGGDFRRLL